VSVTEETLVDWIKSEELVDFSHSISWMEKRAVQIYSQERSECVWLLQHPPIYTAGTSAKIKDLKDPDRFPVIKTSRGGQYTYHGPGQRVIYVMLDLNKRGKDIKKYVKNLEIWVIRSLEKLEITGETRSGRVGIWVSRPNKPSLPDGSVREDKIAAIGVRLKKWITYHGISINVNPDLSHFNGIVPCGISNQGITSFEDLDNRNNINDLDNCLKETFEEVF
tara:strand:+ start:42 stop:707 length:666 start_codon:yes stop_codon:yes gene_type:complete